MTALSRRALVGAALVGSAAALVDTEVLAASPQEGWVSREELILRWGGLDSHASYFDGFPTLDRCIDIVDAPAAARASAKQVVALFQRMLGPDDNFDLEWGRPDYLTYGASFEVWDGKQVPVANATHGQCSFDMRVSIMPDGVLHMAVAADDNVPIGSAFEFRIPLESKRNATLADIERMWTGAGEV